MSTQDTMRTRPSATDGGRAATAARPGLSRERRSTETKAAFKTTEMFAYVIASAMVLIAALIVDESNAGGFGAKQAWLYFTILTVGYMLSRGLAKSGSRDPYTDHNDNATHDGR
jgi:hypothetical protein